MVYEKLLHNFGLKLSAENSDWRKEQETFFIQRVKSNTESI